MTHISIRSGKALLHATVAGNDEARTIVLLHAAVADSRMWLESMNLCQHLGKLVAYDRRGFGVTQYEPEDYSSTADLINVLDAVCPGQRAVLVGCSQGGRIALDTALEHPDRIEGLILMAPNVPGAPETNFTPRTEELLALQADLQRAGDVHRLNSLKAHLWLDGPLSHEGRVSGSPRNLLLEMNFNALTAPTPGLDQDVSGLTPAFERLDRIEVPTLMMWGELDFPHIRARCRLVAEKLRTCHQINLSGVAHLPPLERPSALSSALQLLLSDLGDASQEARTK